MTIYEAHATVSWVNDLLRGVLQESELLEEMGGMSDPANALAHRAGRKGLSSVGTSAEREAVRTEFTRRGTFLPRAKDLDRRRATDDASDAGSRAEEDEDEEDEDEEDNPLSPNEWFRWPNIVRGFRPRLPPLTAHPPMHTPTRRTQVRWTSWSKIFERRSTFPRPEASAWSTISV